MKKWSVLATYEGNGVVAQLLATRAVENIAEFLNPPSLNTYVSHLPKELKKGLADAKNLIAEALQADTPILIYGDYDVDGISAAALLMGYLKTEAGHDRTFFFIPNRFDHGYGLSRGGIDAALEQHGLSGEPNVLWITVDTGITAVDEIAYIKSLGHQLILTDHHQKPDVVPDSTVLVWSDQVVGATLSWLLTKILGSANKQSLALVALATVTDLQPLVGFNRALVKYGLEVLNRKPPLGLKHLLEVSGRSKGEVTTYDLGWVLGPRINALGRLGDADDAVELLLTADDSRASELAQRLNAINIERQDKTYEMYELAADIDSEELPHIIFSTHEDYHEGIIGLVAARLVQKYYRPAVVISLEDGFGKGSVRSIPGINIIETLREFEHLFENVGGHPMAAGFTIKKENIPMLEEQAVVFAREHFSKDFFVPVLEIDMELPSDLITEDLLDDLDKLKPYGVGNRQPVFMTRNFGVVGVDWVGRDSQHLLLKVVDAKETRKAIYFNAKDIEQVPELGDSVDIVYTLKKNEYRNRTYIDLVVKDLHTVPPIDTE